MYDIVAIIWRMRWSMEPILSRTSQKVSQVFFPNSKNSEPVAFQGLASDYQNPNDDGIITNYNFMCLIFSNPCEMI